MKNFNAFGIVESEWYSHRPMLFMALESTNGLVVEMGMGNGSTQLIREYCAEKRRFKSYETNNDWFINIGNNMKDTPLYSYASFHLVENYSNIAETGIDLLFIDSAPGEQRKELIEKFASHTNIIVVHDTEPGAEYVYGMNDILSTFKHRCDLVWTNGKGYPQTTAVSNTFDFTGWKQIKTEEFIFIYK